MSDDCLFDLQCRKFVNGQFSGHQCTDRRTPCLSQ